MAYEAHKRNFPMNIPVTVAKITATSTLPNAPKMSSSSGDSEMSNKIVTVGHNLSLKR